jgi:Tol biopolymer transport system component
VVNSIRFRQLRLSLRYALYGLILLCAVGSGLFDWSPGHTQPDLGEYACLHLFNLTTESDWQYDIRLDVVLPQRRLPGPAHQYLTSADGYWFAFETAVRAQFGHAGTYHYGPLIYVGPTIQGKVWFTEANPIGFIQAHAVPLSLTWSPKGAQLAYLYVSQGRWNDLDGGLPQLTLALFDAGTRRRQEVVIQRTVETIAPLSDTYPLGPIARSPLLQWSPDGTYLAVTTQAHVANESGAGGVLIYDMTSLKLVSFTAAPPSGGPPPRPIALKWAARDHRLAVYWMTAEGQSSHLTFVQPGTRPQSIVFDAQQVVTADRLQWSPDGTYLAILASVNDRYTYQVALFEVTEMAGTRGTFTLKPIGRNILGEEVSGIRWTADSWSLLFFREKELRKRQLVAYQPATKTFKTVVDHIEQVHEDVYDEVYGSNFFPQEQLNRNTTHSWERRAVSLVIYAIDLQSRIYAVDLVNLDTLQRHPLIKTTSSTDVRIDWSPDHTSFVMFQRIPTQTGGEQQAVYWGTTDGRTFRQFEHADLRKSLLGSSDQSTLIWLDDGQHLAYVADLWSGDEGRHARVLLVDLRTGMPKILVDGLASAVLHLDRPGSGAFGVTWQGLEGSPNSGNGIDGYDATGRRRFRYVLRPEQTREFGDMVHAFRAPQGNQAAMLTHWPDSEPAPLFVPQGQHLKRVKPETSVQPSESYDVQGRYTGIEWSPDGQLFAAYTALRFPFSDGYRRPDVPVFTQIDIYTAAGVYLATVPVRADGILWTRCKSVFPAPYAPAALKYSAWFVPPG